MQQHNYTCPKNFRFRWPQVRSQGHNKRYNVRSKFQLSLCARPTHSFWPSSSIFQGVLSSPRCTTYRQFFILLFWGQREVMTLYCSAYGENIQIAPIQKILEIAASFHHICASIPHYVTIRDCFSLLGVLIQAWGQIRSTEVKWRFC